MEVNSIKLEEVEKPKVLIWPAVSIFLMIITLDAMCYFTGEGETNLTILLVIAYILLLYVLIVFSAFHCLRSSESFKFDIELMQFWYIIVTIKLSL